MAKRQEITLDQAEAKVEADKRHWWWDGWTLCQFTPGRGGGTVFSPKAIYNRDWPGRQKWGTLRRYPITDRGTYMV